jgi:hypothetical protein
LDQIVWHYVCSPIILLTKALDDMIMIMIKMMLW